MLSKIFGCCAGRTPPPVPAASSEDYEKDSNYAVGVPGDESKEQNSHGNLNGVLDISLAKTKMSIADVVDSKESEALEGAAVQEQAVEEQAVEEQAVEEQAEASPPQQPLHVVKEEEPKSSAPAPAPAPAPAVPASTAAPTPAPAKAPAPAPAMDTLKKPSPIIKITKPNPARREDKTEVDGEIENAVVNMADFDAKSVISERGGRHKTHHFDLSHKMGFVISHSEESLLVHVISISDVGQAKEKGVEVGWIINKVAGQVISEAEIQEHYGNERTKIVQKIVLESTYDYRHSKSQLEEAKEKGTECGVTEEELEKMRWLPIEFLIPDEAAEDDLIESMPDRDIRMSLIAKGGEIPVQFRGEEEPVVRGVKDLPTIPATQMLKKNPGMGADKKKWVMLHKFALYYSTKNLTIEELDELDSKINKNGERSKLNRETVAIPLTDIIDARVAKDGNLLVLNLSNRKVIRFNSISSDTREEDLFEWADTIVDHKAYYTGLLAQQKAEEN